MGVHADLSRRERQIMEVLYRKGSASVAAIREAMPDPPTYSAVRVIVNVLERKGHVNHTRAGRRYIYSPATPRQKAIQGAVRHLLGTYFEGSLHKAVAAMVELHGGELSDAELEEIAQAIERKKGRKER